MDKIIKKIVSTMLLVTLLAYTMPVLAYTNEETIYSKLDSSGEAYKNIVSTMTDEENSQIEIDKDLPIDCKVTYLLDGVEKTAEEIAGKSGRVTITLEYENTLENTVNINGKSEVIYTPFLVISGAVIDNDNNQNIKISNGKVINNGNKTIAVGFALPGMSESLNLSDDIDIPNKIEISMDSKNFEMGNIMSFATPKILEEGSLDEIYDKLDEVYSQINELENASGELENGTVTLRDGIVTLNNGAQDLNNGVQTLNNGAKELKSGINTLKDGSSKITSGANSLNENYAKIDAGIKQIESQVPTLTSSVTALGTGVGQILQGKDGMPGLVGLNTQLEVVKNMSTVTVTGDTNAESAVNKAIANLGTISATVDTNSVNTVKANIDTQVNAQKDALQKLIDDNLVTDPTAQQTIVSVIANLGTVSSNVDSVTATVDASTIQTVKGDLDSANTSIKGISQTTNVNGTALGQLLVGYQTVASKLNNDVLGGIKQLGDGAGSLVGGITQLSQGSDQVKSGINELAQGANSLDAGVGKLVDGSNSLTSGSEKLANGSNTLASGTNTLLSGGNTLVEGVQKFNSEGIKKISDLINVDVRHTETRLRKMENLSNEYQNFASDESRDEIKFISILDSIKVSSKDENKEEMIEAPKVDIKKEEN